MRHDTLPFPGLENGYCLALLDIDAFLDQELARLDRKKHAQQDDPYDYSTAGPQRRDDYDAIIRDGVPVGQRSKEFNRVVFHLASQGLTVDDIVVRLAQYPNGIASKYGQRLYVEVERSYAKRARTALPGSAPIL